jgi:ABC-type multidrug transport system fused ATPase/permease subunit
MDGKISAPEKPLKPRFMNGDIEFRNVSFVYPSRTDVPVLQGFNLRVPADTTTALVGSSGAGKSTVVSLLQRFYDVNSGSICIDGNDIRSLDLKWMRSKIGYVQQEPQLFGLTVRENVCYGVDGDVTDEQVETACKVSTQGAQGQDDDEC